MIKELEEVVDVPCVHICTVVPISLTVGANRIDPAVAIPHPLGNPALSPEDEFSLRRKIVEKALQALCTDVSEQTVF
jgi:glycine reductase